MCLCFYKRDISNYVDQAHTRCEISLSIPAAPCHDFAKKDHGTYMLVVLHDAGVAAPRGMVLEMSPYMIATWGTSCLWPIGISSTKRVYHPCQQACAEERAGTHRKHICPPSGPQTSTSSDEASREDSHVVQHATFAASQDTIAF